MLVHKQDYSFAGTECSCKNTHETLGILKTATAQLLSSFFFILRRCGNCLNLYLSINIIFVTSMAAQFHEPPCVPSPGVLVTKADSSVPRVIYMAVALTRVKKEGCEASQSSWMFTLVPPSPSATSVSQMLTPLISLPAVSVLGPATTCPTPGLCLISICAVLQALPTYFPRGQSSQPDHGLFPISLIIFLVPCTKCSSTGAGKLGPVFARSLMQNLSSLMSTHMPIIKATTDQDSTQPLGDDLYVSRSKSDLVAQGRCGN